MNRSSAHVLTIRCRDRRGIVAAVSGFLAEQGFSIVEAHQHEGGAGMFFMRVAFTGDVAAPPPLARVEARFAPIAERFAMDARFHDGAIRMRALVLVSRFDHCLHDLIHRWRAGQLPVDVAAVASNHERARSFTEWAGVPFHFLPIAAAERAAQERRILDLVAADRIDLVVLARYMQVLSPSLCASLTGRCINIHHSFLPSFKGAKPYHQAHARGVKIIGATAHYVTTDLDEGPIIEQATRRVSHARSPEELVTLGQELESSVLTRAVRWHSEARVLLDGQRTVVFD